MTELKYLSQKIFWRVLITLVIISLVYNPYFSLYHLILPSAGEDWMTSLYDGWLYKLIALIGVVGIVALFWRTTKTSMGKWGILGFGLVWALVCYIPFYAGLISLTNSNVFLMAYYGFLPVLLGMGLSTGYINRWLSGTLILNNPEFSHPDNDHST